MTTSRRSLLKLIGLAPIAVPAAAQVLAAQTVAGLEFGELIAGEALMFDFDDPGSSYEEFLSTHRATIARSLNVSYEQLMTDLNLTPNRLRGAYINADGDAV
jgi:capsid protein